MISGASQNSFHSAFQLQDVKAGEAGMFIFQGEFSPAGDSSSRKKEFMIHTLQLHIQIHMMVCLRISRTTYNCVSSVIILNLIVVSGSALGQGGL